MYFLYATFFSDYERNKTKIKTPRSIKKKKYVAIKYYKNKYDVINYIKLIPFCKTKYQPRKPSYFTCIAKAILCL